MRVLVTGSEGHIGRLQAQMLRAAGHVTRTFDRVERKEEGDWEHFVGDTCDLDAMRKSVEGMDAVVHMAAIPHDGGGPGPEVMRVNMQGTWNTLFACVEAGVSRLVFYSSVNALGCVGGHKMAQSLPIDDAYPRHPMSPYQLSKHLGEEMCRSFSDRHGLTTICLRPVYVAPPSHYEYLRQNADRENGHWEKVEYFAYVDMRDVCDAALRSLTVENVLHDAFLLTADDTTVVRPTAELVEDYYADTPWIQDRETYLADNPHRSLFDCSHAKQVLGWQPAYSWRTT